MGIQWMVGQGDALFPPRLAQKTGAYVLLTQHVAAHQPVRFANAHQRKHALEAVAVEAVVGLHAPPVRMHARLRDRLRLGIGHAVKLGALHGGQHVNAQVTVGILGHVGGRPVRRQPGLDFGGAGRDREIIGSRFVSRRHAKDL